MTKNFYITTAIAYPNAAPHLGHAYEAIASDVIARFMRLDGFNTFFLSGVDEHGLKIMQTARQKGVALEQFVDGNTALFVKMLAALNCSNDDFIRTTQQRHKLACQYLWRRMADNGDIYLGKYSGWYSLRDEAYYDDKELTRGDDGNPLSPLGTPVEWIEEESYFFRLANYQERLLQFYRDNPGFVAPSVRFNEIIRFVEGGLRDLSISRTSFSWGIPVPNDKAHVMYVWVDALTNYITALGYPDETGARMSDYWPANVHVIGKDINRFHSIYWPAFLMSAGLESPERIFVHGMLLNSGEKMSKSLGNVSDPHQWITTYGLDAVRYFLIREIPFGNDGSYSHEAIVQRKNSDLANDLGNLAQRSLKMIARNCQGWLPIPGELTGEDERLIDQSHEVLAKARAAMSRQDLYAMINLIWALIAETNRYFASQAPWLLAKEDPERMASVLYLTAELVRRIAIMLQPVIPNGAGKLLDLLAVEPDKRDFSQLSDDTRIAPGQKLPEPQAVFPRHQG